MSSRQAHALLPMLALAATCALAPASVQAEDDPVLNRAFRACLDSPHASR